jgi:hypothetical protein
MPLFSVRQRSTQRLGIRPFPTLGSDAALRSLFAHLSVQLGKHAAGTALRIPLNTLVAAPGAGKTFFLGAFASQFSYFVSACRLCVYFAYFVRSLRLRSYCRSHRL